MKSFLLTGKALCSALSKAKVALTNKYPIHVVMGNEAADTDSIVSSIVYAKLLHHLKGEKVLYLAVLPIPRADIHLRTETKLLLSNCGIDLDWLVFSDEFDVLSPQVRDAISLTLVDHNQLSMKLSGLDKNVDHICDHHKDNLAHNHIDSENRIIMFDDLIGSGVGSTCTIVTLQILEKAPELLDNKSLSSLLLGVILLDTSNLKVEAGKAKEEDFLAVKELSSRLPEIETNNLYEELSGAKFDLNFWKCLSVFDCLRIDYKQFVAKDEVSYGMASVLLSSKDFIDKEKDIKDILESFSVGRSLQCLIVMFLVVKPELKREVLVYKPRSVEAPLHLKHLIRKLKLCKELELSEIDSLSTDYYSVFNQLNVKASRKQVQPILNEILSDLS